MAAADRKKILIVDDEPEFLELMRMKLEGDCDIIVAYSGREALDVIRNERPDAVLLDLVMEKMSGLEVLKAIRKRDGRLPVFMLTAYSDKETFRKASQLKAAGFIVKTSNLDKELQCIHSVLGISPKFRR